MIIFLAAANRDPATYDYPDEWRPGRAGPPPLSFAFLARSEAEAMLSALLTRWPDVTIADRPQRWHQRGPFRGLDELVVRVA